MTKHEFFLYLQTKFEYSIFIKAPPQCSFILLTIFSFFYHVFKYISAKKSNESVILLLFAPFFSVHRKTLDGDGPRCKSLHRPIHHAIRHANNIFLHKKIATNEQNQHSRGIHLETDTNHPNASRLNRLLHVYLALFEQGTTLESGCYATCEHLQTALVEKHAVHS